MPRASSARPQPSSQPPMDVPWNTRTTKFSAPPGDANFFPAVLNYIRSASPELPLDPVIFQALLLCLMAGHKHLLLRTAEEDIVIVQNVVYLLLTKVLAYTTYKHKQRRNPGMSPPSYISSLFFPEKQAGPSVKTGSSFRARARRSRSVPTSDTTSPSEVDIDTNTQTSRRTRRRTASSSKTNTRPSLHGLATHSEPVSITAAPRVWEGEQPTQPRIDAILPQALVLSGLENASVPCQRALWLTLLSKRVSIDDRPGKESLAWPLPEEFLVVYVCRMDPYERPPIYKSLLDQFALSANIELRDNTRQSYVSYLASILPQTLSPGLAQPIIPTSAIIPPEVIGGLQALCTPTHVFIAPSLQLYLSDLFAAARHHHELEGLLLTSKAMREAESLVRAHRVFGGGDAGISLIQETAALIEEMAAMQVRSDSPSGTVSDRDHPGRTPMEDHDAHPGPAGEQDIDDGLNVHVQLHWHDTDILSHRSGLSPSPLLHSMRSASRLGQGASSTSLAQPAARPERKWWNLDPAVRFYVSEVDVGKIVPRVISHRLRVRSRPEDEVLASLLFPAVKPHSRVLVNEKEVEVEEIWQRSTVKDILVKLLTEV